jgi:hypothetical protein
MSKRSDAKYFRWLVSQVHADEEREYSELFYQLHHKEFVWIVPNDDNRVQDGLDLRTEYLNGGAPPQSFRTTGVSVLEVLIGLSRRLAFITGGDPYLWAWQLLENIGLHRMWDPMSKRKAELLEETLENLIWRKYDRDGVGGFFPLAWAEEDQTKIELWYQMAAYVNEIHEP